MPLKKLLLVQKYGGATLADPEKIKSVAHRISDLHKNGNQVVAVVSAMGKTTNQLIDLANQVSPHPNKREMDMLLTTGERISMALVSMALHDLNCPAISLTGSQAGIFTDDSHVNAAIIDVKAIRVEESLKENKVVVLAGFQGVSPKTKEITTLGRGGSDTTAIAMASYLKADRCEILKDVAGVFSADPKIVAQAKPIQNLTYDQLLEMTFWGAKVLHYRSVELAKLNKVPLYIGPASSKTEDGTMVSEDNLILSSSSKNSPNKDKESKMFETSKILALNSHEQVLSIESNLQDSADGLTQLEKFLTEKQISFPQILLAQKSVVGLRFLVTGPDEVISALLKEIPNSQNFKLNSELLCTVSATCTGITTPAITQNITSTLVKAKIPFSEVMTSAMSAVVVMPKAHKEKALQALHLLI